MSVTLLTLNCFFFADLFAVFHVKKKHRSSHARARDSEREREREEGTRHIARGERERERVRERGFLRGDSFFFVYLTHFERGKSISFLLRGRQRGLLVSLTTRRTDDAR
jgi:hypothetical protein